MAINAINQETTGKAGKEPGYEKEKKKAADISCNLTAVLYEFYRADRLFGTCGKAGECAGKC